MESGTRDNERGNMPKVAAKRDARGRFVKVSTPQVPETAYLVALADYRNGIAFEPYAVSERQCTTMGEYREDGGAPLSVVETIGSLFVLQDGEGFYYLASDVRTDVCWVTPIRVLRTRVAAS